MKKEFVVYQEKGCKDTVYLNRLNKEYFFSCKLGKKRAGVFHFWLKDSLEYVYFKNVVFDGNVISFDGDLKARKIVFDNCIFNSDDISFSYCDFKLINCMFVSADKVRINGTNIDNFDVELASNCDSVLKFKVRNCQKFSLDTNNNLCELMVISDDCCLKNVNNFRNLVLDVRNTIKLVDCDLRFETFNQSGLIKSDKLIMIDSNIIDGYRDDLGDVFSLHVNSVSGKNYSVKVKYGLSIFNDVYTNTNDSDYLVLFSDGDDRNLVLERRDLISVLKAIGSSINANICDEVSKREDSYLEDVLKQKKRVNDEMAALMKIQAKIKDDVSSYRKELSEQNVGKVMKLSKRK